MKVSIITPLFNKGPYIAETIASVCAQTLPDWEMIVVDNGSTDDGPEQVRSISDQEERICLISSPKRGPGAARNFGLARASGEWVLFLDADDLLEPDYLTIQLDTASRNPQADIIAGFWQEFRDGDPSKLELKQPTGMGQSSAVVCQTSIGYAPWALHTAIIRRTHLTPERQWHEELDGELTEDTAFWFSIIMDSELAWSNCRGALYRTNTFNSRNAFNHAHQWLTAVQKIVDVNLRTLGSLGGKPSPNQCETLMRVFEDHYRRATRSNNQVVALEALAAARLWLRLCRSKSIAILLRKCLGLGWMSRIARCRLSPSAMNNDYNSP